MFIAQLHNWAKNWLLLACYMSSKSIFWIHWLWRLVLQIDHSLVILSIPHFVRPSSILSSSCKSIILSFCVMIFGLFSKLALRIFPVFCKSVEDNRAHCLSQMGITCSKKVFFDLCILPHNCSKDLPNFCRRVEVNRAHRFSQMVFLKKILTLDYRGLSAIS